MTNLDFAKLAGGVSVGRTRAGDVLVLGKPLGVGVLSAALKKNALPPEGYARMIATTTRLNTPGPELAALPGVHALTDVTGFGLLGHLVEMADGSGLSAEIDYAAVPRLAGVEYYMDQGCVPGGTLRNFDSYGAKIAPLTEEQKHLLCDPQTSGGLLVAVSPEGEDEFLTVASGLGLALAPIGQMTERRALAVVLR